MIKVKGEPVFDHVMLAEIKMDLARGAEEFRLVYFHKETQQMFGSTTMPGAVMSKRTRDLFTKFRESMEQDAVERLFPSTNTEKEEVSHGTDPAGLADEAEEDGQI